MTQATSAAAANQPGTLPSPDTLVNVPRLITAYYTLRPDPENAAQRVAFGTSGHRGSAFHSSFNDDHIAAITQAIVEYRRGQGIGGPLFLAQDTHALSEPAFATALEVLAANGVDVMVDDQLAYTPTPALSHAILTYNVANQGKPQSDGIVITPSHNPPEDGGFKYNPPNGGPADTTATKWIENRANTLIAGRLTEIKRFNYSLALGADTTHRHDYITAYVNDLGNVIDFAPLAGTKLALAVDPLGGAGVHYWPRIAEKYLPQLQILNPYVDPTFRFMTLDWDSRIRMDCSSPYAMASMIANKEKFDVAWACDTDHDRHGIVTRTTGLLNPNHYLAVVDSVSVHAPAGVVGEGGDRQDAGVVVDHRPRGEGPGPADARSAGGLQVVRRRADRRLARLRRRRVRRRQFPATQWHGVDHGQGRPDYGTPRRRDDRRHRQRPGPALRRVDREVRRPHLPAHRRRRHQGAEGEASEALALAGDGDHARGRAYYRDPDRGAGKPCGHRRAEGDDRERLVRRTAQRNGRRLQDLRGELQR
jgi:hypothetical protein